MAANKNIHSFWHHFLALQIFMLSHMVCPILFGVLAHVTIFIVKILQQPIRNLQLKVFKANTPEQNGFHHVKEHEKLC